MVKETKNSNIKKKVVERCDIINEEILKTSLSEYSNRFTNQLNDYIENIYTKERKEDGTKKTKKDITKDTGISPTALTNYTTDRLPKYTKTIIALRDYFDVPFSYLFKETPTIDINNIDIGMTYGLNDSSIAKLKELKIKSETDSTLTCYKSTIKLFLINSIINDDDFLDGFSFLLSALVAKKQLTDKYKGKKLYFYYKNNNDYVDYVKYNTYEKYLKYLNKLISQDIVPKSISSNAIAIVNEFSYNKIKNINKQKEQK